MVIFHLVLNKQRSYAVIMTVESEEKNRSRIIDAECRGGLHLVVDYNRRSEDTVEFQLQARLDRDDFYIKGDWFPLENSR